MIGGISDAVPTSGREKSEDITNDHLLLWFRVRAVTGDDGTVSVDQKLLKVPADLPWRCHGPSPGQPIKKWAVRLEDGLRLGVDQCTVERVFFRPFHHNLGEHRELNAVAQPAKLLDLSVRARLLPREVVRRETENSKTLIPIRPIKRLQSVILRGEAAFGGYVDDQQ